MINENTNNIGLTRKQYKPMSAKLLFEEEEYSWSCLNSNMLWTYLVKLIVWASTHVKFSSKKSKKTLKVSNIVK